MEIKRARQLLEIEQVVELVENNTCNTFISEDKKSFLFIDKEDYCKITVKYGTTVIQGETDLIDASTSTNMWEPIELVHAEYKPLNIC